MFLVIISDKVITRFQNSLETSLRRSSFSAEESAVILQKATDHFKSIARANPLKPKSIPDDGLNVAGAVAKLGKSLRGAKEIIVNNPALLFEYHGLVVPETITDIKMEPYNYTSDKRKSTAPRTRTHKEKQKEKIDIAEITKAARDVFSKTGLRPDIGMGTINDGPLIGKKWVTLHRQVGNNPDFILREGFKSLAKIFDAAMIGARHKPCDPKKARDAFCEAFEIAAKNLSEKNYARKIISSQSKDGTRDLPYVFTMVEESILESSSVTGVSIFSLKTINYGPLSGMKFSCDDLHFLFLAAKNENPDFPFHNLNDFIADRDLNQKAAQKMIERSMIPK